MNKNKRHYGQLVTLCNGEAGGMIVLRGIYACIHQLIVRINAELNANKDKFDVKLHNVYSAESAKTIELNF